MFDARWVFVVLGPAFLLLGLLRCVVARGMVPQAKAWLTIGAVFSAVAAYLWLSQPGA